MDAYPDFDFEIERSIIALKNTLTGSIWMSESGRMLRSEVCEALERYRVARSFTSVDLPQIIIYSSTSGERRLDDYGWQLPIVTSGSFYWLTIKAKILSLKPGQPVITQVLLDDVQVGSPEFDELSSGLQQFMEHTLFMSIQQDLL